MWLPLQRPLLGIRPTTQACALTGNLISDSLVCRLALNPLSHTSQGQVHISDSKGKKKVQLNPGTEHHLRSLREIRDINSYYGPRLPSHNQCLWLALPLAFRSLRLTLVWAVPTVPTPSPIVVFQ